MFLSVLHKKISSVLSWPAAVEVQLAVCVALVVHHARTQRQHALDTPLC